MKFNTLEGIKQFVSEVNVGDIFVDLEIEGLNNTERNAVLNEVMKENGKQFIITMDNGTFIFEAVEPSKKFLEMKGQYNMSISDKAKRFLQG